MGPPTCKVVVVKSMLSLFCQLRWDPPSSLEVPMVSTSPRTRCTFLTSHPMFPLWVVKLLPTSPDLPL